MKYIASAIVLLVLFAFTYYGFFEPIACDIDNVGLWCNLHPFTTLDWIGLPMFLLGMFTVLFGTITEKLPTWAGPIVLILLFGGIILIHS